MKDKLIKNLFMTLMTTRHRVSSSSAKNERRHVVPSKDDDVDDDDERGESCEPRRCNPCWTVDSRCRLAPALPLLYRHAISTSNIDDIERNDFDDVAALATAADDDVDFGVLDDDELVVDEPYQYSHASSTKNNNKQ